MDKIKEIRRFFLLQVNDALFPIGGYSHSQGLETYIQQGIVHDEETAAEYIGKKLKLNLACTDLLGVRLAYELCIERRCGGTGYAGGDPGGIQDSNGTERSVQKNGFPFYKDNL